MCLPFVAVVLCVVTSVAASAPTAGHPPVVEARAIAAHLWRKRDLFTTSEHAILRCNEHLGPPRFRLAYMPCRNRGEILRLCLEEARCSYELEVVGFEAWRSAVKASTPHGKLPCLRDYDGRGTDLCQEGAITRFLAASLGLAGRTPAEQAEVDSLYCLWFATLRNQGVSHDGEHYSVAALRDCVPEEVAAVPPYEKIFRQNSYSRAERSLAALRFFEAALERSGTGFLVGDAPTYVDLGLFYVLYELGEDDNVPDWPSRFELPRLGAFVDSMAARPHLADYLASPRRMPRYERDRSGSSLYTYVAGRLSPEIVE